MDPGVSGQVGAAVLYPVDQEQRQDADIVTTLDLATEEIAALGLLLMFSHAIQDLVVSRIEFIDKLCSSNQESLSQ